MSSINHRKQRKGFKIFAIVISVLMVLVALFVLWELVSLSVLPGNLLFPVILIIILICSISIILVNFATRKTVGKILSSGFVIILTAVMALGSFYLSRTSNMLNAITTDNGEVKNTVSLITLSSNSVKSLEDLEDATVGYLKTIDNYGTEQFLKSASEELGYKDDNKNTSMLVVPSTDVHALEGESSDSDNEVNSEEEEESTFIDDYSYLPFEEVDYPSLQALAKALVEKDVDAIILNEVYRNNILEIQDYANFDNETQVIYQTEYYTDKANEPLIVSDITSEPFNIFISGNDTYGDVGELSRSDVNMVVTVNPTTSTILLTSIPRDMYVESECDVADGCQVGAMDKITHLGMHGVNASKMTVENFLGIDINYTFRVNFSSVTDIVDALGGIDIFIEDGMAVDTFYADSSLEGVTEGWNHLNGERALSFARERYAYLDGDNQRVKNQQKVLEAIVNKAISPEIIVKYASLMDAFSGAFETNMSTSEITDLIQYQIQAMPDWKFETYQIAGAGDMLYCAEAGQELSVTVPDMRTVQVAREKIDAVMNGESSETVDISWLDTTSPVYNDWGKYDPEADYKSGSYSSYSSNSSDVSNDVYSQDSAYGSSSTYSYDQNTTYYDPEQDYVDPTQTYEDSNALNTQTNW